MTHLHALTFDAAPSVRHKDENGYLHVAVTPISKAGVNPYLGREIPGAEKLGLDPERIYYGLRHPDELKKAVGTFNGLPLLTDHHPTDAENPAKEYTVGSVGTDAAFEMPYLKNSLTVTDGQAIDDVESGRAKELSCAYRYEPDFTPGEYKDENGNVIPYDFVMRNIRGNHVALVAEGRAGHDVVVADSKELLNKKATEERSDKTMPTKGMPIEGFLSKFMALASDEERAAARAALEALPSAPVPAKDADTAFAAGVKYGEEMEKKEPLKLDSEHESEGLKKALNEATDGCGQDEDTVSVDEDNLAELLKDPKMKAVYEMGVRYGEKREKADPKRIDADHEREGMEKRFGEDSAKALEGRIMAKVRSVNLAARKVRPLVGEIKDPLAFDSAAAIYRFALEKNGVDVKSYPETAYEGMANVMLSARPAYAMAQDSAISGDIGDDMKGIMDALDKIQ